MFFFSLSVPKIMEYVRRDDSVGVWWVVALQHAMLVLGEWGGWGNATSLHGDLGWGSWPLIDALTGDTLGRVLNFDRIALSHGDPDTRIWFINDVCQHIYLKCTCITFGLLQWWRWISSSSTKSALGSAWLVVRRNTVPRLWPSFGGASGVDSN